MDKEFLRSESFEALLWAAVDEFFIYLESAHILSGNRGRHAGRMRFRVECRSVAATGKPRIRDAVIVETADAMYAAHLGRMDVARRHHEPNSGWVVEGVIPLDRLKDQPYIHFPSRHDA